jgi:hypothetical protein
MVNKAAGDEVGSALKLIARAGAKAAGLDQACD